MTLRLTLLFVLASATGVFAISGTTQVAWPGQPVTAHAGWLSNTLELINDPTRTDGWQPWFSGWPNDGNFFTFKVRDMDEVNRLIKSLAAIQAPKVFIKLSPKLEADALAFTTGLKPGNGHAAVFSLGNQKTLDNWYGRRAEMDNGVRKFGVRRYTNTPAALPPTLTLHVGSPSIDLQQLEIPRHVSVTADIPNPARQEKPDDPTFKAIDDFVARHRARQTDAEQKK